MSQHVNAIYEHGVLKPLGALDLHDQEVVSLFIEKLPEGLKEAGEDGPTLFELFDDAGLIACVKDAPADLSTNPKYLEGFGKSGA